MNLQTLILPKRMTSPEDPKFQSNQFQQDFQRLEAEVNQAAGAASSPNPETGDQQAQSLTAEASQWLSSLPQGGKVVVAVLAIVIGLAVVSAVLRLVGFAIQLALLAAIVYGVYRLFFAPKQNE